MTNVLKATKYGDQMFTLTEFTRRPGEVLNTAQRRPVTISRNRDQFALLKREDASALYQAVNQFEEVIEIMSAAAQIAFGETVPRNLHWLTLFSHPDLKNLCAELLEAVKKVDEDSASLDRISEIIHEWRESAAVIQSGVLRSALREPLDEQALDEPYKQDRTSQP